MAHPERSEPGKMTGPQVTFIIPAYNAESTLESAIASVMRQRGASFELIIVDDGSTDSTRLIGESVAARHDDVFAISQRNRGTAAALNRGLETARGRLVAHLDADDEFTDDYLQTMCLFIDAHPGFDMYSHNLWRLERDGTRELVFDVDVTHSVTLDEFLVTGCVNGPGTLVRRELMDRLRGYTVGIYNEDYEFWLRALMAGARHLYCPEPLYLYRTREGQKTSDRLAVFEDLIKILENVIAREVLDEKQSDAAEATLERFQRSLRDTRLYGRTEDAVLWEAGEASAASLRRFLARFLPESMVDGAVRALHRVTWIVRPLRMSLWKVRARIESKRG